MTEFGTWVTYAGSARIVLALVLLAVAGGVALAGARLPLPVQAARPGQAVTVFLLVAWVVALAAWGVAVAAYAVQLQQDHLLHAAPQDPIFPVTLTASIVIFFVVLYRGPSGGWPKLVSAVTAAAAGPVIFELPFDWIVMARVYPPIPPHPGLYRALFFVPFFVLLILTLSLLTLSPMVQLARTTLYCFALMLVVFAIWAAIGFGYPSAPGPIILNIVGKLLAFVTAFTLFWPQRTRGESDAAEQARAREETATATDGEAAPGSGLRPGPER
jgi:hypothetical protein